MVKKLLGNKMGNTPVVSETCQSGGHGPCTGRSALPWLASALNSPVGFIRPCLSSANDVRVYMGSIRR
jgi:hypothetical protein